MTTAATPDDREFLAGEYVLGLLEGEALMRARALMASDPAFAGEVAYWEDCFSPLFDSVPARAAPATVWPAVETAIAPAVGDSGPGANVIDLQRRLTRWRGIASLAMAAAASLALVVLVGPGLREPAPTAPSLVEAVSEAEPLLAANIPIADTSLRLALTYVPERDSVTVSAAGLAPDGVHDHELWLVDRSGGLHSLGVVVPGTETSHSVPAELEPELQPGARLVLTREPIGGKPEGMAAGPVVAEGQFSRI